MFDSVTVDVSFTVSSAVPAAGAGDVDVSHAGNDSSRPGMPSATAAFQAAVTSVWVRPMTRPETPVTAAVATREYASSIASLATVTAPCWRCVEVIVRVPLTKKMRDADATIADEGQRDDHLDEGEACVGRVVAPSGLRRGCHLISLVVSERVGHEHVRSPWGSR